METARPARDDDIPACLELLTQALTDAGQCGEGRPWWANVTPD